MRGLRWFIVLLASSAACGPSDLTPSETGVGLPEGVSADAGTGDGGTTDAGTGDDANTDAGMPDAGTGGATNDQFGVLMKYATEPSGREWFLGDATKTNGEWAPETNDITAVGNGVYQTFGSSGQVRLNVPSPGGRPWWHNVEATAYFRAVGYTGNQPPHWEILARSERHSGTSNTPRKNQVNSGIAPPDGTAYWPWWNVLSDTDYVNVHALGSSYHGNIYVQNPGRGSDFAHLEKEFSHVGGYASQKNPISDSGWPIAAAALDSSHPTAWFGMKWIVRNNLAGTTVHTELWLDEQANNTWSLVTSFDDSAGAWALSSLGSDGNSYTLGSVAVPGCTQPPYSLALDQPLTWAGPWVEFRSDEMTMQFKWLSVREIGPVL